MKLIWSAIFNAYVLLALGTGQGHAEGKKCDKALDIAIVGDKSKSIKKSNVAVFKTFLKELVSHFEVSADNAHFSISMYSNKAKVLFKLNDGRYHSNAGLTQAIESIPKRVNQGTRTDRALKLVLNEVFTTEGGDRKGVPDVAIIFTDGRPTGKKKSDFVPLAQLSKQIRDKGVKIIVIGIGKGIKADVLKEIAGNAHDIIAHPSFQDLNSEVEKVVEKICEIDGNYTTWSSWSECSVTCGAGKQMRSRTCTNPPPSYGGKNCDELGPSKESKECHANKPCPIHGNYTEWSEWVVCDVTCGGGGTQFRERACTNPSPQFGGRDCSELGLNREQRPCGDNPCPSSCEEGLDVGLVIDKSKSIGLDNLKKLKVFLGKLVQSFNPAPNADHFGLVEFNSKARINFKLGDSKYHYKKALLSKIADIAEVIQWGTRTDLALTLTNDELFTAEGGDRPDKPNILLVFTDGKPTKLTEDEFKDFARTVIRKLEKKNVFIVAIGIGKNVKERVLYDIAGDGKAVLSVDSFDELLTKMVEIKHTACVPTHPESNQDSRVRAGREIQNYN